MAQSSLLDMLKGLRADPNLVQAQRDQSSSKPEPTANTGDKEPPAKREPTSTLSEAEKEKQREKAAKKIMEDLMKKPDIAQLIK